MEFRFTEDQQRFRKSICAFLQRELDTAEGQAHRDLSAHSHYKQEFVEAFRHHLAQEGYIGMEWPEPYGAGRDMVYQVIFREEMDYHNAPVLGATYSYLPPAILLFGTPQQKDYFLPRIRKGEMEIYVGYSEPEAGSDLANLQTRAVLEGDEFVVNGQKIFSSGADTAHWGWLAVRTAPDAPKHKGISLILIDMKRPGVSLSWYRTMAGWWHHGVYYDNVRVPRSNLVGELNQGWYHLMGAIDYERATQGNPGRAIRQFDRLLAFCRETRRDGHLLADLPWVRDLLGDLAAQLQGARLAAYWVASLHARGLHPQHETSLASLLTREVVRTLQVARLELMGPYAQLQPGSPRAVQGGEAEWDYRNDTFFHFAAGGFDIRRNVIARRGMGLPRD